MLRFVDTAGMRRRAKVDDGTEFYSVVRALQAVDLSNIALLVIDSTVGVTAQDARLDERVDAAGCPVVVLLNKWELLDATQRADVEFQLVLPLTPTRHRQLERMLEEGYSPHEAYTLLAGGEILAHIETIRKAKDA